MAENNSLHARMKSMLVGDIIIVSKEDYSPSVVMSTAYRVKRDALDSRNYTTRITDTGVEVSRIA